MSGKTVQFRVDGEPIPKARARVGFGGAYTPQRTKDAEEAIAEAGGLAWRGPVIADKNFELECAFVVKTNVRRDIDNLVKTVMDALNGVTWKDDSQVTQLKAKTHRATDEPYMVVRVRALENE